MTLDVQRATGHGLFALGAAQLPAEIPALDLINRCGHILTNMHKWEFLLGPSRPLDTRAQVTITDATTASGTLSVANSELDDYSFLMGDAVRIDAGSSAVESTYPIVSHSTDDLVLETDPGNSVADVDGTIETNAVALPSDFAGIDSYDATNALNRSLTLTSPQRLLEIRTDEPSTVGSHYWGAIVRAKNIVSGGGAPVYRLEICPTPTASEVGLFTLFYRREWTDLTSDADVIPIEGWLEPFFLELVEAVMRGYLEQDAAPMHHRITDLKAGDTFLDAKRRDGSAQPDIGIMSGGAVQEMAVHHHWHSSATTLAEPS